LTIEGEVMNKEQLEQWFKSVADGVFGGLNYTMENTTTVAIASVVVLLVLFLLFGLLAKAARKRRQKKDERAAQRELEAHYE
jgi:hypothetical protein